MRRLTSAEFIQRAIAVHGNKFDYSDTVYIKKDAKVQVRCRACDTTFCVRAGKHLFEAIGCARCSGNVKKTTNEFVADAIKVHGDAYDYSKTVYTTRHGIIVVGCRTCGHDFEQEASVHLYGSGCHRCNGGVRLDTESFVQRAQVVHGDMFDYSRVTYESARKKVVIGCRRCDTWFEQLVHNHLIGQGCRRCVRQSFVSLKEIAWLDSLGIPSECRQATINGLRYNVDALVGRTVYEFYGKYFHGDPRVYASDEWNARNRSTMGDLYQKTLRREEKLRALGYEVRSLWEVDYENGLPFSPRHPHECSEIITTETNRVLESGVRSSSGGLPL